MASRVPESICPAGGIVPTAFLGEALGALRKLTGATAGWVAWPSPDGRLAFPVRQGALPAAWLDLQQGQGGVWGFTVAEGPTLLNDLLPIPGWEGPPLANLLTCPLPLHGRSGGHLALANKPAGFTSHDATALQAACHLLGHLLGATGPEEVLWHRVLDRIPQGVLVLDEAGTILFSNAAWSIWTGFARDELAGCRPPYPFWISHQELMQAVQGGGWQAEGGFFPSTFYPLPSTRPFRRRDHTVLWCEVTTTAEVLDGRPVTITLLRRLTGPPRTPPVPALHDLSWSDLTDRLPFALALTDLEGRVLTANARFFHDVSPVEKACGQPLSHCFTTDTAAALERLPRTAVSDGRGFLVLERTGPNGLTQEWLTCWLKVDWPGYQGFVFALAEDWSSLWPPDPLAPPGQRATYRPAANWLALLLRPGQPPAWWDERWERLTGLTVRDLAGLSAEVILDWLFPRQSDRDLVADLLHHPTRRGTQAVLELTGRHASRPMLCTFLPVTVNDDEGWGTGRNAWVLLAGEAPAAPTVAAHPPGLAALARGLSNLLNAYITVPLDLAEMALARPNLPEETANWFSQIRECCRRAGQLVAALQDLGMETPGDVLQVVSLGEFVRAFLADQAAIRHKDETAEPPPEVAVQVSDAAATVLVNPHMLRTVLQHLLAGAEQASRGRDRKRIEVQVTATATEVRCAVRPAGVVGAADPDVAGLGWTVSQHLLHLHGGNLELTGTAAEGITAVLCLPRHQPTPGPGEAELPGETTSPEHSPAVADQERQSM